MADMTRKIKPPFPTIPNFTNSTENSTVLMGKITVAIFLLNLLALCLRHYDKNHQSKRSRLLFGFFSFMISTQKMYKEYMGSEQSQSYASLLVQALHVCFLYNVLCKNKLPAPLRLLNSLLKDLQLSFQCDATLMTSGVISMKN